MRLAISLNCGLNLRKSLRREGTCTGRYRKSQLNNNSPGVQFSDGIMSADYTANLTQFKEIVNAKFKGTTFENGKGRLERFSMADTAEETDKLVAIHNKSLSELKRMFQRNGVPFPSIAIKKVGSVQVNSLKIKGSEQDSNPGVRVAQSKNSVKCTVPSVSAHRPSVRKPPEPAASGCSLL